MVNDVTEHESARGTTSTRHGVGEPTMRTRVARGWLAAAALPLLAACVTLTADPRAVVLQPAGIEVTTLACPAALRTARAFPGPGQATALDPAAIRILTWNIHKEGDAGWERDLRQFARSTDVLLLQEVTLEDALQAILQRAGMRWVMASSFLYRDVDIGVLTATRVTPAATCTQRVVEPLLQLPKSAVITWLPLAGTGQTLAVANVHAINFTLSLDAYRAQFDLLAATLAQHDGPIVLAGDLNTWTASRSDVVRDVATRLGLTEVRYEQDGRALFFGRELDHVLVRGLDVVTSGARRVTSSDHNPVEVTLRLRR